MKKTHLALLSIATITFATAIVITSCGKKSSSPAAAASSTSTSSNFSSAYPLGLALASPTAHESGSAIYAEGVLGNPVTTTTSDSSLEDKIAETTAMVSSADSIDDCDFNPSFTIGSSNASCYGPTLNYVNHPGGGSGQLPSGDLGLWSANEGVTTEACAAAQLNKKVSNIAGQVDSIIKMTASLYCIAKVNNLSLPAIGATLDLTSAVTAAYTTNAVPITVSGVSITRSADTVGGLPVYIIALAGTASTNAITMRLKHIPAASDNSTYAGKLSYSIVSATSTQSGGNCGSSTGETIATSIAYEKSSATLLKYEFNSGSFCGTSGDPYVSTSNFTVDKTKTYNSSTQPNGWGNNFNYGLFNYNPADSTGDFRFAWQAGANDGNTRTMNVSLVESSGVVGGSAYFGFGPSMTSGTVTDPVGKITKMICNWAGPGNSHTGVTKAQQQVLTKPIGATYFSAVSSAITYAPTNSCDYTTGSNFQYSTSTPSTDHATVSNDLVAIAGITDLTAPTAPTDVDL